MSMAVICPTNSYYDFGMPDLNFPTSTSSRLNNGNNLNLNGANNMSNLNLNGAMPMGSPANTMANVIGQSSMPALVTGNNNNSNNAFAATGLHHHQQQQQQQHNGNQLLLGQLGAVNNNNNNNPFSPPSPPHHQHHQLLQQQQQQQQPQTPMQALHATMLQQRINAAAAAMISQSQLQQTQKIMLHNALSRAVSTPLQLQQQQLLAQQQAQNNSLVNSLIADVNSYSSHRRLERTQSEPLPQVNTSRYKTELCRPFEEAGECKYGEKCQFAHGMHELRNLQRHPKYKTELCRTFHSVGFCPYGPRCHFVHNAEEARNHNRAVHAAFVRAAAANGTAMPMSPPMSMSTGSDRASPTGSLTLSPSTSLASFFPDQAGSSSALFGSGGSSLSSSSSNGSSSASSSASSGCSSGGGGQQLLNMLPHSQQQQRQQQSLQLQYNHAFSFPSGHNSPPHSPLGSGSGLGGMSPISTPPPQQQQQNGGDAIGSASGTSETRLPIFNRLSSTIDAFNHLAM